MSRSSLAGAELPRFRRAEQIMAMPLLEHGWTAEEVREHLLSDRRWPRYELIDGELIVTSPTLAHERLCMWLFFRLHEYLQAEPVGKAHVSLPADLELVPGIRERMTWAPDGVGTGIEFELAELFSAGG